MVGGAAMYPSKNIVENAVNSKDHTTLVAAVKAADLVETLQSAGPFTVFAPTNAAFNKLPKGTVEGLLKADQKSALSNILEYHTYVGSLKTEYMNDGQSYEEVNGQKMRNAYIHPESMCKFILQESERERKKISISKSIEF